MAAPKRTFLFVALGNPGARYAQTRHNAATVLLELYRDAFRLPAWRRSADVLQGDNSGRGGGGGGGGGGGAAGASLSSLSELFGRHRPSSRGCDASFSPAATATAKQADFGQLSVGTHARTGHRIVLAKLDSYMNDSGPAALKAVRAVLPNLYPQHDRRPSSANIDGSVNAGGGQPEEHGDFMVLHDELDLSLGALRERERGMARGHNGLRSIIATFPARRRVARLNGASGASGPSSDSDSDSRASANAGSGPAASLPPGSSDSIAVGGIRAPATPSSGQARAAKGDSRGDFCRLAIGIGRPGAPVPTVQSALSRSAKTTANNGGRSSSNSSKISNAGGGGGGSGGSSGGSSGSSGGSKDSARVTQHVLSDFTQQEMTILREVSLPGLIDAVDAFIDRST